MIRGCIGSPKLPARKSNGRQKLSSRFPITASHGNLNPVNTLQELFPSKPEGRIVHASLWRSPMIRKDLSRMQQMRLAWCRDASRTISSALKNLSKIVAKKPAAGVAQFGKATGRCGEG